MPTPTLQFTVSVKITKGQAKVLVSKKWATPFKLDTKPKDFFSILSLITKGILVNTSGQEGVYQLSLSDWGEQYHSKVKEYLDSDDD